MKTFLKTKVVPFLGYSLINILAATLRVKVEDPHGFLKNPPSKPVIFSFWHNRLLTMPKFYRHFLPERKGSALISRSKDGQIIADICQLFKVQTIRGSSSKHGISAYRNLIRHIENGSDIVITPDGPRGPCYQLQYGVLQLSQWSGSPILPVTCYYSRKWELKSWDRFQIPKPFALCRLVLGETFVVPPDQTDLSSYEERLQQAMGKD